MASNGSGEKPRGSGTDDTIPASEPPLDVHGNPMRASRASIPPAVTQRYRMGIELGRGGMGRVVEAFDTQLGRTVALKEALPKGSTLSRRFMREIEITARLEHASIVPIYDSGTTSDGRPFYVMRRVTGRPLDELINRARSLDERLTLLPNLLSAIDAVAHAHKRGVIHRDLKPANILVGELGETVVIDWGLAKVLGELDVRSASEEREPVPADSLQTQVGSVFGTPGFMPPEQARGEEQTTRGDVYALGATLYHLLAGIPPHGGASATAVLAGTLTHDVVPLAEASPGAPAELIAIAQKAMGFEAVSRYPNAGELAEDVRRFLAGQLVAAHRYTSRQRLLRFAKRHRTALLVAALATVAVAVLAWFSVHRIMQERDAAQQARAEAIDGRRAAEQARDALADRNDALLITQARALVDANPTEAMAVLKQLGSSSSRLAEGRALAQAAVLRGVWTAIETPDVFATDVELSADGRLLLHVARDNVLRIYDLDTKRLRIARPLDVSSSATWIDGGRVLVYGSTRASAILDPAANSLVEVAGPSLRWAEVSDDGRTALVQYADKTPAIVDVATWKATPLPLAGVDDLELAPDGTWAVLANRDGAVAFAADGTELHRTELSAPLVTLGPNRAYVVWSRDRVLRCTLAPKACVEIALPEPRPYVIDVIFRGDQVLLQVSSGELLLWAEGRLGTSARIDQFMPRMGEAAGDVIIVPSHGGMLTVRSPALDTTVAVPVAVTHPRLITRRTSSRAVLTGDGLILVTDLAEMLPKIVPDTRDTEALFVDDTTLLTWHPSGSGWSWLDLASGARTKFDVSLRGFPAFLDADHKRVLVREAMTDRGRLLLLVKGQPPVEIADGKDVTARLLGTDGIVFAIGGRVQLQRGTEPAREIVKLDGGVMSIAALGRDRFVVLSEGGEVVRVELATSAIQRTRIDLAETGFVTSDPSTNEAVIVNGDRILAWGTHVREIARFDRPIERTGHASDGRLIVFLADNDVHLIDPRGTRPSERLLAAAEQMPVMSRDGRLLVGAGKGMQVHVVELSPVARWTLPKAFAPTNDLMLSPSSRFLLQRFVYALKVLQLPQVSSDFHAWLDEHTNAVKGRDDVLVWPWQLRQP